MHYCVTWSYLTLTSHNTTQQYFTVSKQEVCTNIKHTNVNTVKIILIFTSKPHTTSKDPIQK